ncbi:MAG: manganese catalase family protein [Clostridia bacterium]|nr:manganese catalase family protein [Clostridia bacterium]
MWVYEKKLQYPIRIKNPNPKMAQIIMSQYGGPDGELGASLRYLSQRFSMPNEITKSTLNDIGLSAMILLLYAKIGKAYCFQYALPFSLYHFKT